MKPKSYWETRPEILNAGLRGWNATVQIPKHLKEAYPEMRGYDFGMFTEDDVPSRLALGYEFLTSEDFPDWEEMSSVLPIRFGIRPDSNGHIKYKNKFMMYMPTDHRAKVRARINAEAEKRVLQGPSEGRVGQTGIDGYAVVDSNVEMSSEKIGDSHPRRGRPKKG